MKRHLLTTLAACTATGVLTAGILAVNASASGSGRPAAAGGGASAISLAAGGAAAGSTSARSGLRRALLRQLTHGELTLRRAGHDVTVDVQRGILTGVSGTELTVRSVDGFTAQYAVAATTRIRLDRRRVAQSSLAVGDRVLVVARAGGPAAALLVVARTPGWAAVGGSGGTASGGTSGTAAGGSAA